MKTIWKNKIVDVEIYLDLENSLDGTATILSRIKFLIRTSIIFIMDPVMKTGGIF